VPRNDWKPVLDERPVGNVGPPALAIIRHLLATVAPGDDWSTRLVRLLEEFPADDVVSLSDMGLPDDWRARLS